LLIKSHSPDTASHWQPLIAKISSLTILVLLVVGLGLNVSNIINLIGTGGILALLLFIIGSFLIGFLLGGGEPGNRSVMSLSAAQRNISAAIVVTAQNFSGTPALSFVLVGAILMLLILLPIARRLGGRIKAGQPEAAQPGA
jgi:BASS family bile acid:Na+ symporter